MAKLNNTILSKPQTAEIAAGAGKASMQVKARVTPSGLLAIGGLVSGILLSVTALVWASTSVKRKHPIASALGRR
ncbi:hypothetical protein EIP75_14355 [Aquabacterium soli]|uniref:Uncharacterized protein n=1 Tax=Aquabacterium soli TaxID=2493092 RepID=A0A426VAJ9_9BURK|nr:hypothetical protein [Aquabacterium soli]RRS03760.1 hypothetical protein EIP75_14355 [Aquabacterium soli]